MKYKYINSQKILKVSPRMVKRQSGYVYANEEDIPVNEYKELVIEEKPYYSPNSEKLYSWFEETDDYIVQKFKVVSLEEEQEEEQIGSQE